MRLIQIISVLIFFLSTSCVRQTIDDIGGTIVICQFPNMDKHSETPEYILEILKDRVANIDGSLETSVTYNEEDATFRVELPGIEAELADLFLSHGKIELCEVLPRKNLLFPTRNPIIDSLAYTYIADYGQGGSILLMNVLLADTSQIMKLLTRR